MTLAYNAGISIFATGGLGGVHRGAENTMDISADLIELERTPVTVVSSGCKSFLDVPRTLEYLETQGVTVATFADGREGSCDLPAFWTRDSGVPSPMVVRDEAEAAAMICECQLQLLQYLPIATCNLMHSSLHFHDLDTFFLERKSREENTDLYSL